MNSPLPGTAGAAAPAAAAAPATGTVAPNLMGTNPYMQGANTFNPYANLNGTGSYLTSYAGLPGMGLPFGPLGTAGQANANLGRAKLDWPLGLRILPPAEETKGLRQEIEIFVRQALGQAAAGKVSDKVVKEAGKDIDRLSTLLARHAGQLPVSEYTITESKRFLRQLKKTLKELE